MGWLNIGLFQEGGQGTASCRSLTGLLQSPHFLCSYEKKSNLDSDQKRKASGSAVIKAKLPTNNQTKLDKATSSTFLKGEIGSSHMTTRDAKAKILYIRHIMAYSNNDLLKQCLFHRLENEKDRWTKSVNKYLRELNINIHRLEHTTQQRIIENLKDK